MNSKLCLVQINANKKCHDDLRFDSFAESLIGNVFHSAGNFVARFPFSLRGLSYDAAEDLHSPLQESMSLLKMTN